ncbi:MAG: 16S rRNA (uracil(1498)-N(3))-methyltransferase [Candidatus Tectomicrobia bacterium]|uniref:Ribosomal RNA small subunit methyltransferase E n=1 Tax=Tectimicrobiota bacterium TaxID=2528274 RepID=A0A932CQ43_UNCTE|nr:16S rRNA (uracil(1498)-N(3))-methyltransferase [Candidatus Tectomicrobia bacterium]
MDLKQSRERHVPLFWAELDPEALASERLVITGPDVRRIRKALRLAPGDLIRVSNPEGQRYLARIEGFTGRGGVTVALLERLASQPGMVARIVLGQGLPKGSKMDLIVQKSAELGVTTLVPLLTQRSILRSLPPDRGREKVIRWRRIALEAARQSERAEVPHVSEMLDLPAFCRTYQGAELKLLLWEDEPDRRLREALREDLPPRKPALEVAALVGPEGGFSPEEVEEAGRWGFAPVSLGARVLRTETAPLALLTLLLYHLGELG